MQEPTPWSVLIVSGVLPIWLVFQPGMLNQVIHIQGKDRSGYWLMWVERLVYAIRIFLQRWWVVVLK
jgi:hypothetical protein